MYHAAVLVVDDDAALLGLLKTMLEDIVGVPAVLASDGEQALQKAQALKPALVLMDVRMPGIDGLELTRQLKAHPDTKHIPLIALTGWHGGYEQAQEAGCDDFVEKPFELDVLLDKIRKYLHNGRQERQVRS